MQREQFNEALTPEIRSFTIEHGGKALDDLVTLADRCIIARGVDKTKGDRVSGLHEHKELRTSGPSRPGGIPTSGPRQNVNVRPGQANSEKMVNQTTLRCLYCKKPGHLISECRKRERNRRTWDRSQNVSHTAAATSPVAHAVIEPVCSSPLPATAPIGTPAVVDRCKVNGCQTDCLYDTGLAFDATVSRDLIDPGDLTEKTVTLQCLNTSLPTTQHPIAWIDVQSRFVTGRIKAAVLDNPIHGLVLGCKYVYLGTPSTPSVAAAVQTRAQAEAEKENDMPANPMPDIIKEAQQADKTLEPLFKKVPKAHQPPAPGNSVIKQNLLYRMDKRGHSQLVVPEKYRPMVLDLAHSIPFSGHMGTGATVQRITAHYHWPGIHGDVKRHVGSCPQCQKIAGRSYQVPVPLGEMPITGVPFERVAVDIVGPLPLTKKKNMFILTLVDVCSMWAEAVALPHIDTRRVADALLTIFTRLGFPTQILTDNGSQFTGHLAKEVYNLLRIHHVRTSPFHPMSNGQVERWNGTLISIIKKIADEKLDVWDTYLPAALFAYREVPHATTGIAPAMMLFGRPLAGPLEALKKSWTDQQVDETVKTASKYVADLKEKLQSTWATATASVKEARKKQAQRYNQHTKERALEVGDYALLLLPKGNNKLNLSWQGPFPVTERVSATNYKVRIKGKEKIYHLNLLKKYNQRQVPENSAHLIALTIAHETEATQDLAMDLPASRAKETAADTEISPSLSPTQQEEVAKMLQSFPDVMTDIPGKTHLEEVTMALTDDTPIRQKAYSLPFAKRETVKKEIDTLLTAGIVTPSTSPYSAGIVLLRKPSGEHRLCIDYRRLNAVTVFQSEPMPEPDHLFAQLSGAKYFSRLDLSKGYYQIAIPEHLRHLTAFSSPDGHFEFTVMPFGLVNAPSIFSRMMKKLLAPIAHPDLHHFMDDILVATATGKEHVQLLTTLLQRLREAGLTARPTKCKLGF